MTSWLENPTLKYQQERHGKLSLGNETFSVPSLMIFRLKTKRKKLIEYIQNHEFWKVVFVENTLCYGKYSVAALIQDPKVCDFSTSIIFLYKCSSMAIQQLNFQHTSKCMIPYELYRSLLKYKTKREIITQQNSQPQALYKITFCLNINLSWDIMTIFTLISLLNFRFGKRLVVWFKYYLWFWQFFII